MIIRTGSVLDSQEQALIQQVNCVNKMGSGLAKAIYMKWPQVKTEYHKLFAQVNGLGLLGTIQLVDVGDYFDKRYVINAFSQYNAGIDGKQYTEYIAVRSCFHRVCVVMDELGIEELAVPYLYGCGLGGGDWNIVSKIINDVLGDRAICYKRD